MHFIDPLTGLPELGKECYYIVLDGARRDLLRSRARPGDRIMTLREFCEMGLALYSERPVISRNREMALLSLLITGHGRIFRREAMVEIYRLIDELSKNFREIKPGNEKLEELGRIISLHHSCLKGITSRTMIEREALSLMEKGTWFPMRRVYLELYPMVSEVENRIAEALDSMANLTIVSPEQDVQDNYLAFTDRNEEMEFIAKEIAEASMKGTPLENIAVITPSAESIPAMSEILDEYSIPHVIYSYSFLRDTKVFELVAQLVSLSERLKASDIRRLFSSPLVHYKSVNRVSMKRVEIKGEGIEEIEKSLREQEDAGRAQLIADLLEGLKKLELVKDISLLPEVFEGFHVIESIAKASVIPEAGDAVRRESVACRRITEAIADLRWAERITGVRPSLEMLADLVWDATDTSVARGGVAVLLDKTGFWGGFQRTFYFGLDMNALHPEETSILNDQETKALGVLERKKSAEMRRKIVTANMRGIVTYVESPGGFTLFDALGLPMKRVSREGVNEMDILSKADFEHSLAKEPGLIEHAGIIGEEYAERIKSARRCVRSRERCAANEYNGVLGRSIDLDELSVSALEDYVRCPFYCFARRILGLRDFRHEERERVVWGNMVHHAMKELYSCEGGIDTELLSLRGTQSFVENGMRKVRRALEEYDDPLWRVRRERALHNVFPEILRIENGSDDRPVFLEKDLSKEMCGLTLKGRADRIDVRGGYVVYDYKTSKPEGIEVMQVPLYLCMLDGLREGGYYYIIRDEDEGEGLVERKDFFEKQDMDRTMHEITQERVPAIIESMRGGFFPPGYPRIRRCGECEVRKACYITKGVEAASPFSVYLGGRRDG